MAHIHHQRVIREGRWGTSNDQIDQNGVQIQWFHLNISSLQMVIPYTNGARSTANSPMSFWCFITFMNSMTHNAVVTAQGNYCCLVTRRSQNLTLSKIIQKTFRSPQLKTKKLSWAFFDALSSHLCKINGISYLSEMLNPSFSRLFSFFPNSSCDATPWPTASHGSHPTWYAAKLPSISI